MVKIYINYKRGSSPYFMIALPSDQWGFDADFIKELMPNTKILLDFAVGGEALKIHIISCTYFWIVSHNGTLNEM